MSEPVHVLTLNCWGLKYLAKHRHERLKRIGAELAAATPQPAIVALQECWTQQDYMSIREQTKHILPYGKFYFSGIMGGGLAILSKWPIESSNMLRYVLNGRPTAFFRGDWFVGKGVACAKVKLTGGSWKGRYLSVFCTHVRLSDNLTRCFHPTDGQFLHSYTLHMKESQMTHTYAIGLPKHGKSLVS